MTKAQLKYKSFGILSIFIKLIQTTPSDIEAFVFFFIPLYDKLGCEDIFYIIIYKTIN